MYRWTVSDYVDEAIVSLDTNNPHQVGQLTFTGNLSVIEHFRSYLNDWAYGAFGNTIDPDRATAIDIDYVVNHGIYPGERIEGDVPAYDSEVGDDLV